MKKTSNLYAACLALVNTIRTFVRKMRQGWKTFWDKKRAQGLDWVERRIEELERKNTHSNHKNPRYR